jgi:hypothetical protein
MSVMDQLDAVTAGRVPFAVRADADGSAARR